MDNLEKYIELIESKKDMNIDKYLQLTTYFLSQLDNSLQFSIINVDKSISIHKGNNFIGKYILDDNIDIFAYENSNGELVTSFKIVDSNLNHLNELVMWVNDCYSNNVDEIDNSTFLGNEFKYNYTEVSIDNPNSHEVNKNLDNLYLKYANKFNTSTSTINKIINHILLDVMKLNEEDYNIQMVEFSKDSDLFKYIFYKSYLVSRYLTKDDNIYTELKFVNSNINVIKSVVLPVREVNGIYKGDISIELNFKLDNNLKTHSIEDVYIYHNYYNNKSNKDQIKLDNSLFFQNWLLKLNKEIFEKVTTPLNDILNDSIKELVEFIYGDIDEKCTEQVTLHNLFQILSHVTNYDNYYVLINENTVHLINKDNVIIKLSFKTLDGDYILMDYLGTLFYYPITQFHERNIVSEVLSNVSANSMFRNWLSILINLTKENIIKLERPYLYFEYKEYIPLDLITKFNNFQYKLNEVHISLVTDKLQQLIILKIGNIVSREYALTEQLKFVEDMKKLDNLM